MSRWPVIAFFPVLVLIAVPTDAFAHALGVACTLRGDKVEVEVFYDDDTPAQKAKVQVLNANAEVVADGVTDEQGRWTFATPAAGKYEVRADAGAGHRAKKSMTVPGVPPSSVPKSDPAIISEGPTRAEFTGFPWLQVLIGVGVLGGVAGACALASKRRKTDPA